MRFDSIRLLCGAKRKTVFMQQLKTNICQVTAEISPNVCQKTVENYLKKINTTSGGRLNDIGFQT